MRTVYILGAGFSKDAGLPLLDDFIGSIRTASTSSDLSEEERRWCTRVQSCRERMSRISDSFKVRLDNLEELFSLLEHEVQLAVAGAEEDRDALVLAIIRTLELRLESAYRRDTPMVTGRRLGTEAAARMKEMFGLEYAETAGSYLYHAFARAVGATWEDSKGESDSVVSFNYDLVLDRAFYEVGYQIDYGLDLASTPTAAPDRPRATQPIPFYKLHGSANWFRCSKCKDLFIAPPRLKMGAMEKSLLEFSRRAPCPNCKAEPVSGKEHEHAPHLPFIVPPTPTKGAYAVHLAGLWEKALGRLHHADRIVVIGYSYPETDSFFRYMLGASVRVGAGVKLVLVNPEETVCQRFRTLLNEEFARQHFVDVRTKHPVLAKGFDRESFIRLAEYLQR